jgi:uncharacterized protein (TIGR00730 family)
MTICIFCASSESVKDIYLIEAEKLGRLLATSHRSIIYGGGKVGLMGRVAKGALSQGGNVIGVIPTLLHKLELGHDKIAELREVADMHKREAMMMMESDAIIALPGGTGTIEELMQAITWKHLGIIDSPVIIVNINNYFDPLLEMLVRTVEENFMRNEYKNLWQVVSNADEAIELLDRLFPDNKFEDYRQDTGLVG